NHLEIECDKSLIAKGKFLDNISSRVRIRGDATWLLASKHHLIVNKGVGYEQKGSEPSIIIIDGKLTTGSYETVVFASKLFCGSIDPSSTMPKFFNFFPFSTGSESYISGYTPIVPAREHGIVHHIFHSDHGTATGGAPIHAVRAKVVL